MATLPRNPDGLRRTTAVVRWTARALSLASLGFLLLIFVGEALFPPDVETTLPTLVDWIAMAFFPVGLLVGMALGWWRPLSGGLIGVASMVVFYLIITVDRGRVPTGPWFAIIASPALLFMVQGWLERRLDRRRQRRAR